MFINDFFGHFNLEIVQDLELELWNGRCKKRSWFKGNVSVISSEPPRPPHAKMAIYDLPLNP